MGKKNKKRRQPRNQPPKNQEQKLLKNNSPDYLSAVREAQRVVRSLDRRVFKNANVPKGVQYDTLNNISYNNIVYPYDTIPPRLLRLIEKRNNVVGAGITLRIQQALEFANISHDKDIPGWEIVLKDPKKNLSSIQKKQKEFLENLLLKTHIQDYQGLEPKFDTFKDFLVKYVRDRILIDKVVWELERNQKGEVIGIWILDGATIQPVLPGGLYGTAGQVGYGISTGYNKLSDEIRKAKLAQVPPVEEIAYIQELIYGTSGGGLAAAFTENDLIYDLGNELNDVRYYKQGMSVVEKANIAIIAFMNSVTFNSNGLSRGSIPKIAIAMGKESNYTEEALEDMQDEWAANFEAMDGQWNIPILNSDAKVLPLLQTNRDMEYQKYMEFVGALTLTVMGIDPAEVGLRFSQAQNVLSENQDAKQQFSKNRGVREMMGGFSYIVNQVLEKSGYDFADDFVFKFNGLSTEDKGFEAELRKQNVETIKTVDEVRAEIDLPPLPDGQGEIILNAVFMQNKQAMEQAAMAEEAEGMEGEEEEGFGGFSDQDVSGMVDDAMAGMEKAIMLI